MFVCTHNTSAPMEMHAHVLIWGFKAAYLKQRSSYVQWDKATRMQIIWASLRLSQKAARKWNYTLKRSEGNYNLIVSNYGNDGHDIFFSQPVFSVCFRSKIILLAQNRSFLSFDGSFFVLFFFTVFVQCATTVTKLWTQMMTVFTCWHKQTYLIVSEEQVYSLCSHCGWLIVYLRVLNEMSEGITVQE